jgi:SAM-dependent methyltransferase
MYIKKLATLLLISGALMNTANSNADQNIISHLNKAAEINLAEHKARLKAAPKHTLPLDQELSLLEQLTQFELGRFLLLNKGLNGYWTSYVILHGPQKQSLSPLEDWLINKAPVVRATQERFAIFKSNLQQLLTSGMTIASIPCGLMDDLLGLDYAPYHDINLVGIDLDEGSLALASDNAKKIDPKVNVSLVKKNAWDLGAYEQYDIITSNGLNIYEPDDQKVVALYKEFFKALKTTGVLVTSFLTPPPALSPYSPWKDFDAAQVLKQKAVFGDILQVGWQTFRTEQQTKDQLIQAGFSDIEVIYDTQGMFPTIIAKK